MRRTHIAKTGWCSGALTTATLLLAACGSRDPQKEAQQARSRAATAALVREDLRAHRVTQRYANQVLERLGADARSHP